AVTHRATPSTPAAAVSTSALASAARAQRPARRRRTRRRARPTRWPVTSGVRPPTSASARPAPRGVMSPLLTEDADLGLEHDPELGVDALACELHEADDVGRRRAAAVDDEVGVLGRDLGAVDPLAAQADLLDEPRG